MHDSVARQLVELNREFYDRFGAEFSATRKAIPRGIERAIASLTGAAHWLDVGCGDGRIGRYLQQGALEHGPTRTRPSYVGVDSSARLLGIARSFEPRGTTTTPGTGQPDHPLSFVEGNLAGPDWAGLSEVAKASPFDGITCFAVLFHLPGHALRKQLLACLRDLVGPQGRLALSVWQILHHEALRKKVVPWQEVGLTDDDVDDGDLLVTWNQGGRGLRYVHHFRPEELDALCRETGWEIREAYSADGRTGDLSLFRILSPAT